MSTQDNQETNMQTIMARILALECVVYLLAQSPTHDNKKTILDNATHYLETQASGQEFIDEVTEHVVALLEGLPTS